MILIFFQNFFLYFDPISIHIKDFLSIYSNKRVHTSDDTFSVKRNVFNPLSGCICLKLRPSFHVFLFIVKAMKSFKRINQNKNSYAGDIEEQLANLVKDSVWNQNIHVFV